MRTLKRNEQTFYFAEATTSSEKVDDNGNYTGTYSTTYATPKQARMNIGADNGVISPTEYGITRLYDRIIVTDDLNCAIKENSIVWIGIEPNQQNSNFNYLVKSVSKSLNSISIGLQRIG